MRCIFNEYAEVYTDQVALAEEVRDNLPHMYQVRRAEAERDRELPAWILYDRFA